MKLLYFLVGFFVEGGKNFKYWNKRYVRIKIFVKVLVFYFYKNIFEKFKKYILLERVSYFIGNKRRLEEFDVIWFGLCYCVWWGVGYFF